MFQHHIIRLWAVEKNNEDFVSLIEGCNQLVAIVADGLGGYDSGEVASRLATTTINNRLHNMPLSELLLLYSVEKANMSILEQNQENKMKTTISIVWIEDNNCLFATVGDTRVYHFRNGTIQFQSTDHSVSQMAVLMGEIDAMQIRGHKDRNKLIRVLGSKEKVKVDLTSSSLEQGDALLLCSDGFWENITEQEMICLLNSSKSSQDWLKKMRDLVERVMPENNDNHSAIALYVN